MKLRLIVLVSSLLSTFALVRPTSALDVVDDWRKVGPFEDGEHPEARAVLSPRAAAEVVAAVDAAYQRGTPLRSQTDDQPGVVDRLRNAFATANDAPATSAAPGESREVPREIAVFGTRSIGAHRLLIAQVSVLWDEPGGSFAPASLAIVVGAKGNVTDVAVLAWGSGDGCYGAGRTFHASRAGFSVEDTHMYPGPLCERAGEESVDCCGFSEGIAFDLDVGPDGRFREKRRRPVNFSGQFKDATTGEQLRVEDPDDHKVRAAYRTRTKREWSRLELLSADRERNVLKIRFKARATVYSLAFGADGAVVSKGSDGSKPQRFERVPPEEWVRDEGR